MNTVDPNAVAYSDDADFCVVRVLTHEGSTYTFPDISKREMKRVMPESGRIPVSQPSLMMMNPSGAVLTVPLRVVKEVRLDEEVTWVSHA